jgi:murein L,D-transpeptidase YafK
MHQGVANALPCELKDNYLSVDTQSSTLFLCSNQDSVKTFKVALGRGGLDKKIQGDGKTPLGSYSLGTPRSSKRFFSFIPIGYPTPAQNAQGFTGSDVGVHGPLKYLSWLGRLNNWVNWTNGCVAVGSSNEISEIVTWVNENHVSTILIK